MSATKASNWSHEKNQLYRQGNEVSLPRNFSTKLQNSVCVVSGQEMWYSDLLQLYHTSSKIKCFISDFKSHDPLILHREKEYKVITDKAAHSLFLIGKITGQTLSPDNFDPSYLESIYDQAKPSLDNPSFMRQAVTDAIKDRNWDLLWALLATEADIAKEEEDVTDWGFFDVLSKLLAKGDISEADQLSASQTAASGCDGLWMTRAIARRWKQSGLDSLYRK